MHLVLHHTERHGPQNTSECPLGTRSNPPKINAVMQRYADEHGLVVVRKYGDAAKRGLRRSGRDALQQLLADVPCSQAIRSDCAASCRYSVRTRRRRTGCQAGQGTFCGTAVLRRCGSQFGDNFVVLQCL
jgi:hypothetical protein